MGGPTRLSNNKDKYTNPKPKGNPVERVPQVDSRLEFEVDKQIQMVHDRGVKVRWEQSYICTCLSTMTKSPKMDCPICRGKGIAYLPAKSDIIILQSQDKDISNTDLGLIESGTAIGTTVPNSKISFRDRITVPDVSIRQSMLIKVTPKRVKDGFRLPYDVNSILLARTTEGRSLELEKDYKIDLNDNIFYPNEEFIGENIALNIDTILRYVVIDLLKESRYQYSNKGTKFETFVNLPKKLLLRREDAWVDPVPTAIDEDFKTDNVDPEWDDPKRRMSGGFFGGSLDG